MHKNSDNKYIMRLIITFNNKNVVLPEPWTPDDRLRLEALENGSVVGLANRSELTAYSVLQYSLDGTTWNDLTTSTSETLNTGDKFYIRGKLIGDIENGFYTNRLALTTGSFAVKGNIMHLYDYEYPEHTTVTHRLAFGNLFVDCTALVDASELLLPATTLTNYGTYRYMFCRCPNLVKVPKILPATKIGEYCCEYMFYGCTKLTESPILVAATLSQHCYGWMFWGCTSINKITSYAQSVSVTACLENWLNNASSRGDFYNLGGATYPRTTSGIPSGWTIHTTL